MNEVIAGCYQFDVVPAEPERNLEKVEKALPWFAQRGCRLLVLPEMWSCDFVYPRLEAMAGLTPQVLQAVSSLSLRYGMVIVGSLPEAHGGAIFNTSYVMDSTGRLAGSYRKAHLFSLHGEDKHFVRGTGTVVCSTAAGCIGVVICYDVRFPEITRKLALDGAQIVCVSALWPSTRIEHWSLLLRCRALENQFFVVGCNGSGSLGGMVYGGASAIVNPTGRVLAEAGREEDRIVAGLHLDEITAFRELIPCFADRQPGIY